MQLTRNSAEGLKLEVEQFQVLIRELQERIQSDDRVGELESSLQNVQDRASELEFQLSKAKQVCRPCVVFSRVNDSRLMVSGQQLTQG